MLTWCQKRYHTINSSCWGPHGDHLAFSLDKFLQSKGMAAYNFSFKGCFPVDFKPESSDFENNLCFEKIKDFKRKQKY